MPYPTAASPRRRLSALVSHAPQRPSTPQGSQWGDVRQWAGQVVEKIRVASATGRVRFLPWYDPYTDETPEIRAEYRKMLTESSVKAAFQTKILSVISLDVQCQAADDDDPRQQQASQFLTYAFRKVKGGMRRVGWSVLHPAVIDGHSVCEKVWKPEVEASGPWRGKRIYDAVKAKDTKFIQLGIDPFRNITGVRGMAFNAGRIWSPEDFIIFSYLELFENPAGTSDFRAAYRPYWIKNTVWQLRSLHLDKYVGPYLKGQYTTQDQKDALEAALQEARSTTWLTVPIGTIVEAIDLSMRGTSDFDQAIKDCDREILIAIVGAHLQILEGQTSGARGNTKVHKETSELIQWFLAASLADVYREQLAAPLIAENFAGVEVPDVSVGAITEEAMLDSLKVDEGLQKLGWKLSRRDLGKRYARPWPEPDDALEAPQPPQQPPGAAGGGPDGAGPFSERVRRFCMEGENKGLPGVCPEDKGKETQGAAALPVSLPAAYRAAYQKQLDDPDHAELLPALRQQSADTPQQPNPALAAVRDATIPAGLTQGEKVAQQVYSYGGDGPLNGALRTGAPVPAHLKKINERLQSAFAKAPVLGQPVHVVRGMKLPGEHLSSFLHAAVAAQKSGEPVAMAGYTSTAVGGQVGKSFKGNVEVHVRAVHGLDMMPTSHFPQEKEFLLNHDSQFRVAKVEVTRSGVYKVHLEQLPPAGKAAAPLRQEQYKGRAAGPEVPAEKLSFLGKVKSILGFSEGNGYARQGAARRRPPQALR